jgi:hypothetical protein
MYCLWYSSDGRVIGFNDQGKGKVDCVQLLQQLQQNGWEPSEPYAFSVALPSRAEIPDADQPTPPLDFGIDAASVGQTFAWGFGAVLFFWFLGYGIGVALSLIRKV